MFTWNRVIEKEAFLETITNDTALLDTVIALFAEQSEDTITAMRAALTEEDWTSFRRAVHDVKNLGRSVASRKLVEHSQQLEQLAVERQINEILSKVDQTATLLDKALKELTKIRKQCK